jgi:hypothetical protein
MQRWGKGKKIAAVAVVLLLGLIGIGALDHPSNNSAVQGEHTTNVSPKLETPNPEQAKPAPAPSPESVLPSPPPPIKVSSPTPAPAPTPTPSPSSSVCTPGYSPCIAPGLDVDCAGGSGNGPRYVSGPIYVTGTDVYGLDRDNDGIGCE